jgi:hypothetical protein
MSSSPSTERVLAILSMTSIPLSFAESITPWV